LILTLSVDIDDHDPEALERSFDFAKLPSLREVGVKVHWRRGSLHWIPTALSTLKPVTSPHLSTIRLTFDGPSSSILSAGVPVGDIDNDLRRVADEFSRIEHEYEGAVNLTLLRDLFLESC